MTDYDHYHARQLAGILPVRPSLTEAREMQRYEVHPRIAALDEARYPKSLYGRTPAIRSGFGAGTPAKSLGRASKAAMTPGMWYTQDEMVFKAVKHAKNGSILGVMLNHLGKAVKTSLMDMHVRLWKAANEGDIDARTRDRIQNKIDDLKWESLDHPDDANLSEVFADEQRQDQHENRGAMARRAIDKRMKAIREIGERMATALEMYEKDPERYSDNLAAIRQDARALKGLTKTVDRLSFGLKAPSA